MVRVQGYFCRLWSWRSRRLCVQHERRLRPRGDQVRKDRPLHRGPEGRLRPTDLHRNKELVKGVLSRIYRADRRYLAAYLPQRDPVDAPRLSARRDRADRKLSHQGKRTEHLCQMQPDDLRL